MTEPATSVGMKSIMRPAPLVLAVILVGSFVLKLPNLGHPSLKPLDESFHAIVAANLMKHPWAPTLHDGPAIEADPSDWQNSRIWLHKPPMALWQIALSYAIFGVNTLALRLPSAILATLAVGLTYLIGKELLDETAALVAAALQAFNAPIAMLVHGYVFSDHIDISLLFWTELGIYALIRALRTQRRADLILCGVAQGLAFLSKSYPALIVTGLCAVVWLWNRSRLSGRSYAVIAMATLLTLGPWNLYAFMRWPDQFMHENLHALRHLTEDIEQWAAPWDRVVFDYWIRVFHVYYVAVFVAAIVVCIRAWRLRDLRLAILAAWGLGVLIPHLLATSKTMTATLIGWPAMWLMLGYLVSQALGGCGMSAGAWAAAVLLGLLIGADDIPISGWGYPSTPGFAVIMAEHVWVVWHVIAALLAGVVVAILRRRWLRQGACVAAAATMLFLAVRWWNGDAPRGYAYLAWRVTQIESDRPSFAAIGRFIRRLPGDSVFMVDERPQLDNKLENKLIQFVGRRSCYPLKTLAWQEIGQMIIAAGGVPYVISADAIDLPAVFHGDGRTIYACTPKARSAAEGVTP